MDSLSAAQAPTAVEIEGYENVNGRLVPWAPVVGKRKLTVHSKMKCPRCQTIVGVSYSGMRFLELHQNGKKCLNAQRKLLNLPNIVVPRPAKRLKKAPVPRVRKVKSSPIVEPPVPTTEVGNLMDEDWDDIRGYYESLGSLNDMSVRGSSVAAPEASVAASGPSVFTDGMLTSASVRGSSVSLGEPSMGPVYDLPVPVRDSSPAMPDTPSPLVEDISTSSSVEDMLLTPPLVPTEPVAYGSLPPLVLPPPPSLVPSRFNMTSEWYYPNASSSYVPMAPRSYVPPASFAYDTCGPGCIECAPKLEYCSCPECVREPVSKRLPSLDSSDDELSPTELGTPTPVSPAHVSLEHQSAPATSECQEGGPDVPDKMDAPKYSVSRQSVVDEEEKFWDELFEGPRLKGMVRKWS